MSKLTREEPDGRLMEDKSLRASAIIAPNYAWFKSLLGTRRHCMRYPTIDRIHAVHRVMIPSPRHVTNRSRKDSVGASITWNWRVSPMVAGWVKNGFTSTDEY